MNLALRLSQGVGHWAGPALGGFLHCQPSLAVPPQAQAPNALPAGSRMTAEKFLNRLPKFVIRQGEVVDIRGPIRDTLQVRPALAPPDFLGSLTQPTRAVASLETQAQGLLRRA